MSTGPGRITPGKRVEITAVHGDLTQQVVQITVDRLCLVLDRHLHRVTRSREWVAPAGILLSILLTFATTDFRDRVFSADLWAAVFLLLAVSSAVWLIIALVRLRRAESVDQLVERIKSTDRP